jgi:hypothetical protein
LNTIRAIAFYCELMVGLIVQRSVKRRFAVPVAYGHRKDVDVSTRVKAHIRPQQPQIERIGFYGENATSVANQPTADDREPPQIRSDVEEPVSFPKKFTEQLSNVPLDRVTLVYRIGNPNIFQGMESKLHFS